MGLDAGHPECLSFDQTGAAAAWVTATLEIWEMKATVVVAAAGPGEACDDDGLAEQAPQLNPPPCSLCPQ